MPAEIKELHDYGVTRIFSPEDGQKLGLQGMIGSMVAACDEDLAAHAPRTLAPLSDADRTVRLRALAQTITAQHPLAGRSPGRGAVRHRARALVAAPGGLLRPARARHA